MAKILVTEKEKQRAVELRDEIFTVGRELGCSVQIHDEASSRKHIVIKRLGSGWVVEDLQSRHGTLLNDTPVQGKKQLHDGDRIRIGEVEIRFEDGLESVAQAVGFLASPNMVNLVIYLAIGAAVGGVGWFVVSTLNDLTAKREREAFSPTTTPEPERK